MKNRICGEAEVRHSRAILAGAALSVAFLARTAAYGQTGEIYCPRPGTQLKLSNGVAVEFLDETDPSVCRLKFLPNGRTEDRILGLIASAAAVRPNIDKIRSLVPLQVGKKVTWDYRGPSSEGPTSSWTFTLSVEKYEPVTTPAGVFPCYVLLYAEEQQRLDGKWEWRSWYSPDIGYRIKHEFRTVRGIDPPHPAKDWTMVDLKRPPETPQQGAQR